MKSTQLKTFSPSKGGTNCYTQDSFAVSEWHAAGIGNGESYPNGGSDSSVFAVDESTTYSAYDLTRGSGGVGGEASDGGGGFSIPENACIVSYCFVVMFSNN